MKARRSKEEMAQVLRAKVELGKAKLKKAERAVEIERRNLKKSLLQAFGEWLVAKNPDLAVRAARELGKEQDWRKIQDNDNDGFAMEMA